MKRRLLVILSAVVVLVVSAGTAGALYQAWVWRRIAVPAYGYFAEHRHCAGDDMVLVQLHYPNGPEWKCQHIGQLFRNLLRERRAEEVARAAQYHPPVSIAPAAGVLTAEQVASYLRAAGFPESVIPTMVAIAARESGWNPSAVNPSSGACGLLQMYPCPGPEALDPATNAAMAFAKYEASGLSPWGY